MFDLAVGCCHIVSSIVFFGFYLMIPFIAEGLRGQGVGLTVGCVGRWR
jgi:hypothetical protein